MNSTEQKVVKFVQELLIDQQDQFLITPDLISDKIDIVIRMNPKWGELLDRDAVTDELTRRFSLWVGQDTTLQNNVGHIVWLNAGRKGEWRYWQRYREWLERRLSFKAVDALDRSTDSVLSLIEDPRREGAWDRRGLVVGHVQSGKTGHYTGLICKAADAGYKIIIVLAGLHNNLRSQTQMRLDEGFLGYETKPRLDDIRPIIGVGEIDGDPGIRPNYATNRSDKGDFSTNVAKHLGITPEQRPWLFVVKKNKTVLDRLYSWIRDHVANTQDQSSGRKVVSHLPLLLIDDEADHASVDTGEQVFDSDGQPDENHQPTAINKCIRRILHTFTRSAYVGYTATPFANIFIHERGETRQEGPDLFPAAFIANLSAGSNYIGPARIFGLRSGENRDEGVPLVRIVADHVELDGRSGWMPHTHKSSHRPLSQGQDSLPPSLIQALDAFLLACAVRQIRGQGADHSSMLIHVTRFTAVQTAVHRQVETYIRQVQQRLLRKIDDDAIISRLKELWEKDFIPTSDAIRHNEPTLSINLNGDWDDIRNALEQVLPDIHVRMINGTAKDALDYADNAGAGLKVIAIGGDKLARGLTLEGLCTSYFLRASRMYDTLMQMGRWFGYRPGYLDVSRLYTTSELSEWFGHITDAAEELREEFELMAASGATPREYGLKVQSHSSLMVTSRLKMRTARNLMLSFSGQLLETVVLFRDPANLTRNLEALGKLVSALGRPDEVNPKRIRGGSPSEWKGFVWSNAPAAEVIAFLTSYRTHPAALRVNSSMLAEFIQSMSTIGELTNWTVALIGGGQGGELTIADEISINMLLRRAEKPHDDRYSIGRLMSPRDEAIDMDGDAWESALTLTRAAWSGDPARSKNSAEPDVPSGPAIRKVRGFGSECVRARPDRGVLVLYALDPAKAEAAFDESSPAVVAFGISFPGSTSGTKVEYKVNNVLWEQEFGPSE